MSLVLNLVQWRGPKFWRPRRAGTLLTRFGPHFLAALDSCGMLALPGSDVGLSHLRSMLALADMKALNMLCAADSESRQHNCGRR
jgi:hypothetical protein